MKLLLAGGGTAGHINPALAIAGYVCQREPATQILYVGAKGGMEERLVPQAGYDFEKIEISGFQRKLSFESLKKKCPYRKAGSSHPAEKAKKIISRFQPDLCIGTGGYVSGPVIRQAQKMGIPTLIHEQNAFPGVTNKMLSKHADRVMLAIEDAKRHMDPNASFTVTGNPVRGQIVTSQKQASRDYLRLDNRPVILSFGGSLGARKINEAAADLIAWSSRDDRFQHIHAYGQYGKWFPELLEKKGVDLKAHKNLDIREYINNMPELLAAADLVISRAGALTLAELEAEGRAAILIPSPNVAENHQYYNAMELQKAGAAVVIEEKDLTGEKLVSTVSGLLAEPGRLAAMGKNARTLSVDDSLDRIADALMKLVKTP